MVDLDRSVAQMVLETLTVVKMEEKVRKNNSLFYLSSIANLKILFTGQYCCTNGQNNPECRVPTTPTPTYLPPVEETGGYKYPKPSIQFNY